MNDNYWLINIKQFCFVLLIIYINQKNKIKSFINIISKKKVTFQTINNKIEIKMKEKAILNKFQKIFIETNTLNYKFFLKTQKKENNHTVSFN